MKIHVIEPLAISGDKIEDMTKTLSERGHEILFFEERNVEPEETIRRAQGADIVVIANQPFPELCVNALPDLKMLAVAFTGVDHVAVEACREKGIRVCNASGYSTINVAELTVGLIIDLLRNVTKLDPVTRAGGTKEGLVGRDLAGKTVGIIGMGAIGQKTARILHAFDCRLIAVKREKTPLESELGIEYTSLEDLLEKSDIVTLHCPLNESTRGLIGKKELALMKENAFLVNCARGPVVNTEALVDALKSHQIAGAGLDVFDTEPPLSKDLAILQEGNTVVTPHIAFATEEAFVRRADIVVDNILKWIEGNPINVVA